LSMQRIVLVYVGARVNTVRMDALIIFPI
jgi:hypothetical protein